VTRPLAPDLISALEHFPISWTIEATEALGGSVSVAFTPLGGPGAGGPDDSTTWYGASWADTDAAATTRVFQLTVAGSDAAGHGAFPGIGDYTCWARYTDGVSVRIRAAGVLRFR